MAIKKNYQEEKPTCKVTFSIPKEVSAKFKTANLVGDFNNWDTTATPMKKLKRTQAFTVTLELDCRKEYEFRYFLDGELWMNESEADKLVPTYFQDAENSVIAV